MIEENSTEYLDGLVEGEKLLHYRIYVGPNRLPIQKGRESVAGLVFRVNYDKVLLEEGYEISPRVQSENLEFDLCNNSIGYWVGRLKEKGLADDRICEVIEGAKENYFSKNGISSRGSVVNEGKGFAYDSVVDGLKEECGKNAWLRRDSSLGMRKLVSGR